MPANPDAVALRLTIRNARERGGQLRIEGGCLRREQIDKQVVCALCDSPVSEVRLVRCAMILGSDGQGRGRSQDGVFRVPERRRIRVDLFSESTHTPAEVVPRDEVAYRNELKRRMFGWLPWGEMRKLSQNAVIKRPIWRRERDSVSQAPLPSMI
jgi:hypothetical protein